MTTTVRVATSIDATGLQFRDLNARLREAVAEGADRIELRNVYGQRYIGTDLDRPVRLEIFGTPGNDLGSFMDGPTVVVHGNAQDGCGNTMNAGEIIVEGHAGDIIGMSARGGKIFVRDNAGYRAAIHMKEYQEKKPVIVVGGTAQDFAGEYMAGGVLVMLGLTLNGSMQHKASFIGTGMHAGVIYLRGTVNDYQLGKEVGIGSLEDADRQVLDPLLDEFGSYFGLETDRIAGDKFIKLTPRYLRPYGRLYAY